MAGVAERAGAHLAVEMPAGSAFSRSLAGLGPKWIGTCRRSIQSGTAIRSVRVPCTCPVQIEYLPYDARVPAL